MVELHRIGQKNPSDLAELYGVGHTVYQALYPTPRCRRAACQRRLKADWRHQGVTFRPLFDTARPPPGSACRRQRGSGPERALAGDAGRFCG